LAGGEWRTVVDGYYGESQHISSSFGYSCTPRNWVHSAIEAANNGTNCAPLTPGCSNVPTALQVKQFVQQQCLGQFNNSSLGGAVNFMSMTSPVIGPNPLGSTIEDVGGTTLKYGVYQFFNSASQSMAGTPFGSMSGIVAEGIETIAKDVVLPVAVGATGLQVIAHAGCATVGGQAAGQMNPLPPGIQF
jgi:hypothetical protein